MMRKKVRISPEVQNPHFARDSADIVSWVRVVKDTYPHERVTACCRKRCRLDDIVVTFPAIVHGELRGTAILHKQCLMTFLETVPDERDIVFSRWQNIREKHTRKSSTCNS